MLCEYGCGQEAKYQLKSGKWCCSKSYNSCPELRKKNSKRRLETSYKIKCEFCNKEFSKEAIHNHKIRCKKNLDLLNSNKKLLENKLNNKYINIYNKIILNRQLNPLKITDLHEIHHILPVCLSGTNDISNLICLSPREHYICHALLAYAYKETEYAEKLFCAFFRMSTKENIKINSRLYEKLKSKVKNIKRTSGTINKIVINKDNKNKFINKEDLDNYLKDGWKLGMIMKYNPNSAHNKGKILISKDNKNKFINKEDLDNYLKDGWKHKKYNEKIILKIKIKYKVNNKNYTKKYKNNGMKGKILINNKINQTFVNKENLDKYLKNGWFIGGIKGLKAGKPKSFRTKEHCEKLRIAMNKRLKHS